MRARNDPEAGPPRRVNVEQRTEDRGRKTEDRRQKKNIERPTSKPSVASKHFEYEMEIEKKLFAISAGEIIIVKNG